MDARRALQRLGSDEQAVAQTLRQRGFQGRRQNLVRSPIEQYLTAATGRPWMVSAGIAVTTDSRPVETVVLPLPVRSFARSFEAGSHPELESSSPKQPDDAPAGPARRRRRGGAFLRWLLLGSLTPLGQRRRGGSENQARPLNNPMASKSVHANQAPTQRVLM